MTVTMLTSPACRARGLAIAVSTQGPTTVVALQGEADGATLWLVNGTFDRVIADYAGPVVVELAETAFIDSDTVRILSRARRALGEQGRLLTVRSPSRTACLLLELFGLSDLIQRGHQEIRRYGPEVATSVV